jgi:hypothetical protein
MAQELAAYHRRLSRQLRVINARDALSVKPLADRDAVAGRSLLQMHQGGEIRWVEASYTAIHHVLTNPVYAGAYVYGRTRHEIGLDATSGRKKRVRQRQLTICSPKAWKLSGVRECGSLLESRDLRPQRIPY